MVVSDDLAFPATFLAALLIGAVPIPVSTMLKAARSPSWSPTRQATVVVVSGRHAGHAAPDRRAAPSVQAAVVASEGQGQSQGAGEAGASGPGLAVHLYALADFADESAVEPAPTSQASAGFWLYTSGTTGRPKARHPPPR